MDCTKFMELLDGYIDGELTAAVTDIIVNGADVQATLDELAAKVDELLAK